MSEPKKTVISVSKPNVRCCEDSINDYIAVLNGISYACHRFDEYCEGNRNTIAVDLTVAAYMLGLDAQAELREFIKAGLIDPLNDDDSPAARVDRVLNYRYKFDWDWMIDPGQYTSYYPEKDDEDIILWYELDN